MRNPEYIEEIDFVKSHFGIDHIINPDLATAIEIERYISKTYNLYSGDFAKGKVSMVDFHLGVHNDNFVGKKIKDIKDLKGLLITAISRNGQLIIPHGSTQIEEDDVIHVVGGGEDINRLAEILKVPLNKKESKRVMILGEKYWLLSGSKARKIRYCCYYSRNRQG